MFGQVEYYKVYDVRIVSCLVKLRAARCLIREL